MTTRGGNASRQRIELLTESSTAHTGAGIGVELSWHAVTHIGYRRDTNEDSYVAVPPLFAVADGMGGHAAGEVASAAVVRRLAELGGPKQVSDDAIIGALSDAVDDIELDTGGNELGAGTTVTGVTLRNDGERPTWRAFNIGDSRVYHSYQGVLSQLTVDHSVVQHLIDTGAIAVHEAEVHPHANVITRAVGFNEDPVPDFVSVAIIPGQRLLVCSDGLTKELTDAGIQHYLASSPTVEDTANALLEQALGNAGRDNITVIVIEVHAVGDPGDTRDLDGALVPNDDDRCDARDTADVR